MQLAGLQLDIAWEDKAATCARIRELLRKQPPEKGGLLVLPEMYATGFSMDVATIAEPEGGPAASFLAELARTYGVWTIGGLVQRDADGKGHNLALVCDPTGREVTRYSKLHPFCLGAEQAHYRRGDSLCVLPWQGFTIGLFICYDLRFPEAFRQAVRRGADLLVVIANWPAARAHHWRTLLTARAIENQAYVIGVNRIGRDPHLAYSGDSLIINPRGELLADGGDKAGCIQAELDSELIRGYRRGFPALQDLRPEFLGPT